MKTGYDYSERSGKSTSNFRHQRSISSPKGALMCSHSVNTFGFAARVETKPAIRQAKNKEAPQW
jgi:hypothetical protein